MRRLLAPFLAVAFLAALIGCGGSSSATFDDGTTSTTSGSGGTNAALVPAGTYTTSFTGTNDATPTVGFSGTGTGSVAADGTVALTYTSVSNQATPVTTTRTLTAVATTANAVTGSLVVGADAAIPATVTLANVSGAYRLTAVSTVSGVTETDVFALTASRPGSGTYTGTVTGTDNHNATYFNVGTQSATVASNGTVSLSYISRRSLGSQKSHTLSTTLLADGTFSGALGLDNGGATPPVTGTWSLGVGSVLTLRLVYVDTTVIDAGQASLNPTVTETLVLTKQ